MAKFNELVNEEALDRLADLIEPLTNILTDSEVKKAYEKSKLHAVKAALKVRSNDVINALAIYDGIPVEEFHCTGVGVLARVMQILSDPDLVTVFQSSEQKEEN